MHFLLVFKFITHTFHFICCFAMNEYLTDIYYDPKHPAAFSTVDKLYNASRKDGKSYSRADVERFLLEQDTYTLYKPQRKRFPTRKTKAYGLDDVHQSDLGDMS